MGFPLILPTRMIPALAEDEESAADAVPVEFLEPDTVYELEVLALEESGNQTITVGFFKTE